jgi:hypothetical protein
MRTAVPTVLLIAALAGCGGGSKKTASLTQPQYAAALDKLCTNAKHDAAAVTLTSSMATWKKNGDDGVKIAKEELAGFEALTPPKSLRDAAERLETASQGVVTTFQDATDAAKKDDLARFNDAIRRQQNFVILSRTAASVLGAQACS